MILGVSSSSLGLWKYHILRFERMGGLKKGAGEIKAQSFAKSARPMKGGEIGAWEG